MDASRSRFLLKRAASWPIGANLAPSPAPVRLVRNSKPNVDGVVARVSVDVWNARRRFLERRHRRGHCDLRCPMATNQLSSYSRRSAGVLLLVGVLAGVTVGGGVGVIAATSTKSVTV